MKANTRRSTRTSFDGVADIYDKGRPEIARAVVDWACGKATLSAGSDVLEVGAGTGQLTRRLVEHGFKVTALEPGERMAALLSSKFSAEPDFKVVCDFFEAVDLPANSFQAIAAANSFHWVDPAVSYRKASELLAPGGSLLLFWNFPILADSGLQRGLNESVFRAYPDFIREPTHYRLRLEESLAEGRRELADSGAFSTPDWELVDEPLTIPLEKYGDLLLSYANAAHLDSAGRGALLDGVRSELRDRDTLIVTNYLYALVARTA